MILKVNKAKFICVFLTFLTLLNCINTYVHTELQITPFFMMRRFFPPMIKFLLTVSVCHSLIWKCINVERNTVQKNDETWLSYFTTSFFDLIKVSALSHNLCFWSLRWVDWTYLCWYSSKKFYSDFDLGWFSCTPLSLEIIKRPDCFSLLSLSLAQFHLCYKKEFVEVQ